MLPAIPLAINKVLRRLLHRLKELLRPAQQIANPSRHRLIQRALLQRLHVPRILQEIPGARAEGSGHAGALVAACEEAVPADFLLMLVVAVVVLVLPVPLCPVERNAERAELLRVELPHSVS